MFASDPQTPITPQRGHERLVQEAADARLMGPIKATTVYVDMYVCGCIASVILFLTRSSLADPSAVSHCPSSIISVHSSASDCEKKVPMQEVSLPCT